MRSKFFQKLFYNWQVKVISFLLAVLVYFILVFSIQSSRTVSLPVEVVMPKDYVATSNVPKSIDLVIQGTEDQIYLVDVSNITLKVDFSMVDRVGVSYATVQINMEDLSSYVDTSAISIYTKPSQVRVYFSEKAGAGK